MITAHLRNTTSAMLALHPLNYSPIYTYRYDYGQYEIEASELLDGDVSHTLRPDQNSTRSQA